MFVYTVYCKNIRVWYIAFADNKSRTKQLGSPFCFNPLPGKSNIDLNTDIFSFYLMKVLTLSHDCNLHRTVKCQNCHACFYLGDLDKAKWWTLVPLLVALLSIIQIYMSWIWFFFKSLKEFLSKTETNLYFKMEIEARELHSEMFLWLMTDRCLDLKNFL